jgi:ribosome-associated toxin RatA of RatAB toxin-antitoxin module
MTWINRSGAALPAAYKCKISAILLTCKMITFPYIASFCLKNMWHIEKQCHAACHCNMSVDHAGNNIITSMVCNFAGSQTVREIT